MIKKTLHKLRTAAEVFNILPEGILCQVIENVLYMSPAPQYDHQRLVMIISAKIHEFVSKKKLGECTPAPVDVYLDENNIYQPDIVYIDKANLSIIKSGKVKGTPDIVIEIMSPGNENYDKVKKRKVYEACGVKEYFIIHQRSKEVIALYLKNGKFEQAKKISNKIISKLLRKSFVF